MTINLDKQNEANEVAAIHLRGRDALVTANAGSGKTHLLVERYFQLLSQGVPPHAMVAFTFTEKAARQLKDKILFTLPHHPDFSALPKETLREWRDQIHGAPIGTIHQFCLRILQESATVAGPFRGKIIDEATEVNLRESTLNEILQRAFEQSDPAMDRLLPVYGMPGVRNVLREFVIQRELAEGGSESPDLPPLEEQEEKLIDSFLAFAQQVKRRMDQVKQHHHWFSFDDLEFKALENLVQPNAPLQKFLSPLLHVLVDEFQDTAPIQIALLEALRNFKGQKKQAIYFFAVGDPKQSIYRFRNVDRRLIERTEEKILKNGGQAFILPKNYRSVPEIVEFANHFSTSAFRQAAPSEALRPASGGTAVQIVTLAEPEGGGRASRQAAETQWMAQKIFSLHQEGHPWETMAVLFRASASALPLIDALKQFGIPFTLRGGRDLFDRQEILDLKTLLYFLANPQENLFLIGLLRSPIFLISDAALYFLTQEMTRGQSLFNFLCQNPRVSLPEEASKLRWALSQLQSWVGQAALLSSHTLLRNVIHQLDLRRLYGKIGGDWEAPLAIEQFLTWLHQLESEMDRPDLNSVIALLKQLRKTPTLKAPLGDLVEGGGVQLLTIHSAKGLQFPTVFFLDLARSTPAFKDPMQYQGGQYALKIPNADGEWRETVRFQAMKEIHLREEAEENNRLLYVALTRAQDHLWIPLFPKSQGKNNLDTVLRTHIPEDIRQRYVAPGGAVLAMEPDHVLDQAPEETPIVKNPEQKTELPRLTVSQMEAYSQCPLKYYFSYQQGFSDEAWEEGKAPSQTLLGTLLHRGLHHLKIFPKKTPAQVVQFILQTEPLWNQEGLVADLASYLENYLNSPPFKKIAAAREDYSELPFLLKLKTGFIRGQLDRLIRLEDQWCLIDFKFSTKKLKPEQILKDYGFQLKTYALAARQFLQGHLPTVEVHLLSDARTFPLSFSEKELSSHQDLLEKTIAPLQTAQLEEIRLHEFCYSCPFNRKVPLCPVPHGHPFVEGCL